MAAGHRLMAETITLLALLITLNCADWAQTLDISDRGQELGIYETNALIGKQPDRADVNTYFAIAIPAQVITGFVIDKYAGRKWRDYFWVGCIGVEAAMVANNYSLGLRVEF